MTRMRRVGTGAGLAAMLVVIGVLVGPPVTRIQIEGRYVNVGAGTVQYAGGGSGPGRLDPSDGTLWLALGIVLALCIAAWLLLSRRLGSRAAALLRIGLPVGAGLVVLGLIMGVPPTTVGKVSDGDVSDAYAVSLPGPPLLSPDDGNLWLGAGLALGICGALGGPRGAAASARPPHVKPASTEG